MKPKTITGRSPQGVGDTTTVRITYYDNGQTSVNGGHTMTEDEAKLAAIELVLASK